MFVIPKSQGPRCVLFCALYTGQSPTPLKFPYLPSSHAPPCCSPSLRCSLRSLPPSVLSLAPSMPTFLPHLFPSSILPSSTPAPTRPHIIASSLPPSPTLPLLPSSILPRSFSASLPACLPPVVQFNVHRMCGWQAALYCVAPSHA